jgi:hypothetical protein
MKLSQLLSDEDEPSLELSFAISCNPILMPTYYSFPPFSFIYSSNLADLITVITTPFGMELNHQAVVTHC